MLDLNRAEDNLTAFVKIRGSLTEEKTTSIVSGRVYGIVEGQPAKPFFGLLGFQIGRYRRVSDTTFLNASHYFALYTDLRAGKRARALTNPFNGKTVEPPLSQYGPSTIEVSSIAKEPTAAKDLLVIRPWARVGNILTMTDVVSAPLPSEAQPDLDLTTYTADWRDIQNTSIPSAPSTMGFTAVENWRDWMQMGSLAGSLLWHVTGHKLGRGENLPSHLANEAMKEAPEMFDPLHPAISN